MTDKHPPKSKEDAAQDEADRIGVYLVAAAGYRAGAFPEFFDRSFFIRGKTGSRFSDLFGMTQPDQKRLRGMRALVAALPAGCGAATDKEDVKAAFAEWQKRVVEDRTATPEAELAESRMVKLDPPLQMELNRLKFSPDGKFLLAQDDSSIYVLNRDPLSVRFRVDADRAEDAWFSPDSSRVTFATPGLHTEQWSVSDGKQVEVHEPLAEDSCLQAKISPDGRTIVCVSFDREVWEMNLRLIDAASGKVVFEKKPFFKPTWMFALTLVMADAGDVPSDILYSSFSSDGNYLLTGPADAKIAIDLRTREQVKIGGALRSQVTGAYAFLGNDRVAGVNLFDGHESGIYSFPEGKRLEKVMFGFSNMGALSDPGGRPWVLSESIYGLPTDTSKQGVKDFRSHPAEVDKNQNKMGVADLERASFVIGSRSRALDIWKDSLATEGADGSLLTATLGGPALTNATRVKLPMSPLGVLKTVSLSPDGRILAYSTRDRGGFWDLATGKLIKMVKPFQDAAWTSKDQMYADFRKSDKDDRRIVEFNFTTAASRALETKVTDKAFLRFGLFLDWQDEKKGKQLIVHRPENDAVLWSKNFPDGYPYYTASYGWKDLIFGYAMKTDYAKGVIKANATLANEAVAVTDKDRGRLVEIVDAETGKLLSQIVVMVPPDYAGTSGMNRSGDTLFVQGAANRTVAYSLTSGKRKWEAFGWVVALDAANQRVCMVNRRDEAMVYSADGKEIMHLHGGQPIRFAQFEQGGAKLMMLMADQTVRVVDVKSSPVTQQMAAAQ